MSNGDFQVSVTVTNSGRRAGKEVVQLYVSDLVASLSPRRKRAQTFCEDLSGAGTKPDSDFKLRPEDLSFIGADNKPCVTRGVRSNHCRTEGQIRIENEHGARASCPPACASTLSF